MQHTRDVPVAPSARTELAVPAELDELVLSCLAKEPEGRPRSADELAQALAGVPMNAAWTAERAEDWWRRYTPAPAAVPLAVRGGSQG